MLDKYVMSFLKKLKDKTNNKSSKKPSQVCNKAITHQLCARALLHSKFSEQEYE